MWNNGVGGGPPNSHSHHHHSDGDDPASLAASALAAYTCTTGVVADQQPGYGAAAPASAYAHPDLVYQARARAQTMEALRRQEEIRYYQSMQEQQQQQQHQQQHQQGYKDHNDDDDDDDDDDDTEEVVHVIAAASVAEKRLPTELQDDDDNDDDDDDDDDDNDDDDDDAQAMAMVIPVAGNYASEQVAVAVVATSVDDDDAAAVATVIVVQDKATKANPRKSTTKKKRSTNTSSTPTGITKKKSASRGSSSKGTSGSSKASPRHVPQPGLSMDDTVPPITDEEYENVEALMMQFCRVPLLAEFSRPVSLLHPELMTVYSKIVKHPMDLGRVCRGIRRRSYKDTRAIRMDMWRIFTNCIKYHSHPSNKDNAVPAFISIALHLRIYFNALWQEFMMPSDASSGPSSGAGKQPTRGSPAAVMRATFEQRDTDRLQRLGGTATTILSKKCMEKIGIAVARFIENGGCVDALDEKEPILGENAADDDAEGDLDMFVDNLKQFQQRMKEITTSDHEYTVEEMVRDLKRCYNVDLFENHIALRVRIANRIDRMLGKVVVPIHETSCRGVNQSSIWGCMAAGIWARESSKKPYWPALVLGILAPECQREVWHLELTSRNEGRLPERLLADLQTGKRKAEQSIKRDTRLGPHQHSYFLVEFMGTHEFIWVKEGDIIESFDPDDDPNAAMAAGSVTKKKRSTRNIADSKTFLSAIEEGRWALEEFELQLSDACGDQAEEEDGDDEQEMNYSYAVLGQSDDEADDEDEENGEDHRMTPSDIEEANELLATNGLIDYTVEGRKNARKRSLARKKEKVLAEKAAAKKEKNDQLKKDKAKKNRARQESAERKKADKQKKDEKKELEKRRKKRQRARKEDSANTKSNVSNSNKKRRIEESHPLGKLGDKQGRATAIVNGYLTRILKTEEMKNLSIAGVLNFPSSTIDSTGLLGMALAFRAAAGEVPMPDDAESKFKPWEVIKADAPKSSAERTKRLEKQLDLLQKKLEEVKSSTVRRKEMAMLAKGQKIKLEAEIIAQEVVAKKEIMGRTLKKKPAAKSESSTKLGEGVVLEGTVLEGDSNDCTKVAVVEVVADNTDADEEIVDVVVAEDDDKDVEEVEVADVEEVDDSMEVEAIVDEDYL